MKATIREVIGFRGENILELCLTDYQYFHQPLFRPGFLGDKWPTVDFYVELLGLRKDRPYFLGQVKATATSLLSKATHISVPIKQKDVVRLRKIPGPTYVFGVHEPSRRVFVRSVHANSPTRSISTIAVTNELTPTNLKMLRNEVRDFWRSGVSKPLSSIFS